MQLTALYFEALYKGIVVQDELKMIAWVQVVRFISRELTGTNRAGNMLTYGKG